MSWWDDNWCHAVLPQIAEQLHTRLQLIILIGHDGIEQDVRDSLERAGVSLADVRLEHLATDTCWIRDYGPLATVGAGGETKFVETLRHGGRYRDEDAPSRLARRLSVLDVPTDLSMEWGGFLGNRAGLCLVSTAMLERNQAIGLSAEHMTAPLKRLTGATQVIYLDPLHEEPTGHVDVFATFTWPNTLVIGDCGESSPPAWSCASSSLPSSARSLEGKDIKDVLGLGLCSNNQVTPQDLSAFRRF